MRIVTVPPPYVVLSLVALAALGFGPIPAGAQQLSGRTSAREVVLQQDGLLPQARTLSDAPPVNAVMDEGWSDAFGLPGVNYRGEAVALHGDDVYVGGQFDFAGTAANAVSLARWNATTRAWSTLGDGPNNVGVFNEVGDTGVVSALAVDRDRLYVGGAFSFVDDGGIAASNIAVWGTTTGFWANLGTGTDSTVLAVAVSADGDRVYVGGAFTEAGGQPANHVAVWDVGTRSWSGLGTGTNSTVWDIALLGGDVYVGGAFTTAGGETVNGVARWDGAAWLPLQDGNTRGVGQGPGTPPTVFTLATDGVDLFLGGDFEHAGGTAVDHVARWDVAARTFSAVGSGFVDPGVVYRLAFAGQALYAAGRFTRSGTMLTNQIAVWRGTGWEPLGEGLHGDDFEEAQGLIRGLAVGASSVYAAGNFTQAGAVPVRGVARWDEGDRAWHTLTPDASSKGLQGVVDPFADTAFPPLGLAAAFGADGVYVVGSFNRAGDVVANSIARWDPALERWFALGTGIVDEDGDPGLVQAVAISGDKVYVGGLFAEAGGVPAKNVAVWDAVTEEWAPLGEGTNQTVRALTVSGDRNTVYVGGLFTEAGGQPHTYVARWDVASEAWSALAGGSLGDGAPGPAPGVRALELVGHDLYVAGNFRQAGGEPAGFIARWDGTAWFALQDGGVNGTTDLVIELTTNGTDVFLGGVFEEAGGKEVNGVARWSPAAQAFSGFGSGFDDAVTALALDPDGVIYAGGAFRESGASATTHRIALWNEGQARWDGFGSGPNSTVWALVPLRPDDLFIVGLFVMAGGHAAFGVTRYGADADNAAPTAGDDVATTTVDTPLEIDVLGNDTDPNSDFLIVIGITDDPVNGTAEIVSNGRAVRYTPQVGFIGQDLFRYQVSDGRGGEDAAAVIISVLGPTATDAPADVPLTYRVHGNYPNPFNPVTTLVFDLPEAASLSVEILDVLGRQVLTLPEETRPAGAKQALTVEASHLASGVYLYRLVARTSDDLLIRTGRMTVLK